MTGGLPSADEWKTLVEGAIPKTLKWEPIFGTHWDLRGECPHCHHPGFSYVDDFTVRRLFRPNRTAIPGRRPGLHIKCEGDGCGTAHGDEGTGCGAGAGVLIDIAYPK